MASVRSVFRLAPRAQFLRPTPTCRILPIAQRSYASARRRPATDDQSAQDAEQGQEDLTTVTEDPNLNGNYPDPSLTSALPIKRQFRDPYGDWWDKQERRNYGEPLHEDNDILGIFSPHEYTHVTPGWGLVQIGCFVAAFCSLCLVVRQIYPDRPSAPRTFPDGLEKELGGPLAPRGAMTDAGFDDASYVEGGSRSSKTGTAM
ncbi:hypothetical protein B0A54_03706 [Friedmanniomyces endolithicus]|uniref:Uncharacterized protein n=1 Tax=Friedmanniomyces endolithicus TaxID=329885 RepID=A0A4U0VCN1_9PEZI|nr:hypothetical protein LTS09_015370 [Friedmanniomyces endolithicus]KAK0311868.1 hypothetical protein LTR01_002782 [Friedmanniomyces endolithicus]KAK0832101.1 hypothetical protein LTR73_002388 [Friedmanniomyces endolithicus]TKA46750.1 hypothetical protein B0A54_03706 [Friedmanniomyces endolithicus]